ncbi:MAG: small-conductance mechanosensitive channel [Cyclobacteriaceae bacterium]
MEKMEIADVPSYLLDVGAVMLIVVGSYIIGRVAYWILAKILGRHYLLEKEDISRLKKPLLFVILVIGLQVHPLLRPELNLPGWEHLSRLMQITALAWVLIVLIKGARAVLLRQYDVNVADNLKARKVTTQLQVFERIFVVLIVILAFAFGLMTFDSIRQIGASIIASAGIAGLIIGVAAQKLLANLLAGFQIAISQPIRLDDVVIVENEWGRVEEITLTYVVIQIWDQRRLVVPSNYFIEKPFQNWTRQNAELLGTVFIYTDYMVPVDKLREALTSILEKSEYWDGKVNVLQVTNATEKAMEIRALMSAKDSPTAWDLRVLVREQLITFLQKNYPECLPKSRVELVDKKED